MSAITKADSMEALRDIVIKSYEYEFQKGMAAKSNKEISIPEGNALEERVEMAKKMVESSEELKMYTNSFIKFKSPYYTNALGSQIDAFR